MEIWKNISGYPPYAVSDKGKVRNNNTRQILYTSVNKYGYVKVSLSRNGREITRLVHLLVAEAFGIRQEGLEIDHIDGNKLNNALSNLRAVTRRENQSNPATTQKKAIIRVGRMPWESVEYPSVTEASRQLGIPHSDISACLRGKRKHAGGYSWKYKN